MKLEKTKKYIKNNYKFFIIALLIAIIGHLYFIKNQIMGNSYMVGPGDQSAQMIIFKDYLYNQFKNGNFFYSFTYNGGGNFFTRLSYYYSTSIVFYITSFITFILETLNIISEPDIFYWVQNILFVSIFRSALIIVITTKFIEMFNIERIIAILGASMYAVSVIYFRHTALWEMFSDALLWLPILLIGVEKIIRGEKGTLFTVGVFLTLFNNGAFAFVNLLITAVYIILRLFVRLTDNEIYWFKQIKKYIINGLVGFGLALPGFVPFVLGYLHTSRLTSDVNVTLTNFKISHLVNLLYIDKVLVVPFLFLFMIFIVSNYKNKTFSFFAIFSIVLILLRYSPIVGSIMNGFGHPKFRWPYVTNLFIGITISLGIKEILRNKNKNKLIVNLVVASSLIICIYFFVQYVLMSDVNSTITKVIPYLIALQIPILFLGILMNQEVSKKVMVVGSALMYISTVLVSNQQLSYEYNLFSRNQEYYTLNKNQEEDLDEVLKIIEADAEDFYRIDYDGIPNFGLVHNVPIFKNYSSFQNKHQQYFNRYFQIDPKIDSNGKIDGLAGRKNLNSIFNVDYVIIDNESDDDYKLPNNYKLIDSYKQFSIYKNDLPLAFIHPVYDLYSVDQLDESSYKDDLILKGAIVSDEYSNVEIKDIAQLTKEIDYDITFNDVTYENGILNITGNNPQIKLSLDNHSENTDNIVIEYTLKPHARTGQYQYTINDHPFDLVGYIDEYSSQIFRNEIHLPSNNEVIFSLNPNSDYTFELHTVHEINDSVLEERHKLDLTLDYKMNIEDGKVDISFNNTHDFNFMVLPIFNELGWQLKINNEDSEIVNTNNGMVGFEIPNDEVNIELNFAQPFLKSSIIVAVFSLLALIFINMKR